MEASTRKALLIINPASRMGAGADLQQGLTLLREAGITLLEKESTSAEHSRELIHSYRHQVDLVVIGGGDGTISSASDALYECGLPFAILPLGTANDLARSVGVPHDIEQACQLIVANHRRRVDLGVVNDRFFFNVAHIGLGVSITYELTPEIKKKWGVFSYLAAFFRALSRKQVFRLFLQIDTRTIRLKSIHLAIGNGRFYGGGNVVDERAQIDSGELFLYSLKPQSVWELLTLAPLLRGGRQRLAKRTFTAHGKRITVKTARPMEIFADGEPAGFTPAVFEIRPGALEVIAPPSEGADTGQPLRTTETVAA